MQSMGNGAGHALRQRAYDQRVQKTNHSRGQKIDEEGGTEFLGALVERLRKGARHPEAQHGAGKLKGQVDLIVRMQIPQITRLFRPCLNEKIRRSLESAQNAEYRRDPSTRSGVEVLRLGRARIAERRVDFDENKEKRTLTIAGPMRKSFQCEVFDAV